MIAALSQLSRALSRASLAVSIAGLVAMTAIIGWQVFARYVLQASPSWSEQAALLLMLYYILFAAAVGVREDFHIRLTMVMDALPEAVAKPLRIAALLVVGVFGAVLAYYGGALTAGTWSHTIPTLGLPRGVSYVPLAGAGALMAFFALEQILADLRGAKVEPLWNS